MPNALDCGVSIDEFWGLTILEMSDIIESKKRMIRAQEKAEINRNFVLAEAISTRISYFFSDPKTRSEDMIVQPWDYYPDLYENEKEEAVMRKNDSIIEEQRQKVLERAERINAYRRRKEEAE